MTSRTNPSPDATPDEGVSLDQLSQAFAQAMGRRKGGTPTDDTVSSDDEALADAESGDATEEVDEAADPSDDPSDDACEISPRSILEAMLFVGSDDDQPLTVAKAAELMRGVEPDEIPALVAELNERYSADGCPYEVTSEESGYRLSLRAEFEGVRSRFYGRIREARLSQAAIDVLAIVAYQQPLSADEISQLRGTPSNHLVTQLVRRQLLRVERPEEKGKRPIYFTTDRFLELFDLDSLDDLPQTEELESR